MKYCRSIYTITHLSNAEYDPALSNKVQSRTALTAGTVIYAAAHERISITIAAEIRRLPLRRPGTEKGSRMQRTPQPRYPVDDVVRSRTRRNKTPIRRSEYFPNI